MSLARRLRRCLPALDEAGACGGPWAAAWSPAALSGAARSPPAPFGAAALRGGPPAALLAQRRGAKTAVLDLKRGNVLDWHGKPASVQRVVHTKGLARQMGNVDLELKDVATGNKLTAKMRPNDTVEQVQVETREASVMYRDREGTHLMDSSTFEQVTIPDELLGDPAAALVPEGTPLRVVFYQGAVVSAVPPEKVVVRVVSAGVAPRGTASGNKPVQVEGGATVAVPHYISEGDLVEVRTSDGSFSKRATE